MYRRWQYHDEVEGLTWGRFLTLDDLTEKMLKKGYLKNEVKILELGSGYGRLLISMLKTRLKFKYYGIDLNEKRIKTLREKFPHFRFDVINIAEEKICLEWQPDLIIGILLFKHIYPDFGVALENLKPVMDEKARLIFDLKEKQPLQVIEPLGNFLRVYSPEETQCILTKHNYKILDTFPLVHDAEHIRTCYIAGLENA